MSWIFEPKNFFLWKYKSLIFNNLSNMRWEAGEIPSVKRGFSFILFSEPKISFHGRKLKLGGGGVSKNASHIPHFREIKNEGGGFQTLSMGSRLGELLFARNTRPRKKGGVTWHGFGFHSGKKLLTSPEPPLRGSTCNDANEWEFSSWW